MLMLMTVAVMVMVMCGPLRLMTFVVISGKEFKLVWFCVEGVSARSKVEGERAVYEDGYPKQLHHDAPG